MAFDLQVRHALTVGGNLSICKPAHHSTTASVPVPSGRAGSLLGDRWTLLILRDATVGVTRFDAFRDGLGIADNILSARLRRLVDAGVLARVPYQDGNRTRHEYRLTQAGADLLPVLRALADWGGRHTSPAEPAPPMQIGPRRLAAAPLASRAPARPAASLSRRPRPRR